MAAVVALALFMAGVVTGYALGISRHSAENEAPRPEATNSPVMESWATYTNRRLGYRISYPSSLAPYLAATENTLLITAPGPSDTPLLRIDVYQTALDPSSWWREIGRHRYPWLFNTALNRVELTNSKRYGALAGLPIVEVVAQRRSPGGATLPASVLLVAKDDRLFAVIDDTDAFAGDADADAWRLMLATFRFVPRENSR